MKVLIAGGEKVNNMVNKLSEAYSGSVDLCGIARLGDIAQFLNRGETFDKALILDTALTERDGSYNVGNITSGIREFISRIQEKMPRFNLVFLCNNQDVSYDIVRNTADLGNNAVVIWNEHGRYSSTMLNQLIINTPDKYGASFNVIDLQDLKRHDLEKLDTSENIDSNVDEPVEEEPVIIETVQSNKDWSAVGSDDIFRESKNIVEPEVREEVHEQKAQYPFDVDEPEIINNNPNVDFNKHFGEEQDPFGVTDTGAEQGTSFWNNEGANTVEDDPWDGVDINTGNGYGFDEPDIEKPVDKEFNTSGGDRVYPVVEKPDVSDFEDFEEENGSYGKERSFGGNQGVASRAEKEAERGYDKPKDNYFEGESKMWDAENNSLASELFEEPEKKENPFEDTPIIGKNTMNESPFDDGDIWESNSEEPVVSSFSNGRDISGRAGGLNNGNNNIANVDELFGEEEEPITSAVETQLEESNSIVTENNNRQGKGLKGKNKGSVKGANTGGVNGNKLSKLKERLEVYRRNGAILTITGSAGSGKTTVTANLANILCKFGYNVLVIDMDTNGRGQSYINYDNFVTINSGDDMVGGVKSALSTTSDKTGRFVNVIRPGFHLLGTGLRVDRAYPNDTLDIKYVNKFLHNCQNSYNFVLIDLPFDAAIGKFDDMVNQSDHLIMVERLNNYGLMNMLLNMMSIDDGQLTTDLFEGAKIVFNMEDGCNSIFGKKVSSTKQALTAMDIRLSELLGYSIDYSFCNMNVVDCIKYNREFENYWFSRKYYSDTPNGNALFTNLLINIFEV